MRSAKPTQSTLAVLTPASSSSATVPNTTTTAASSSSAVVATSSVSSSPSSSSSATLVVDGSQMMATLDQDYLAQSRWSRACVAGSIAGLTEHSLLYPIDTVKTRLQAIFHQQHLEKENKLSASVCPKKAHCAKALNNIGNSSMGPPTAAVESAADSVGGESALVKNPRFLFIRTFSTIVKTEGPFALFRGLPAVLTAAVPSHAAYFGMYEFSKHKLGVIQGEYQPMQITLAAVLATGAHDLIVTPFDVVKQRMQLEGCAYANVCRCAIETFRTEGYTSFLRSYPSTLMLNIPMFCTNFLTYEWMKLWLANRFPINVSDGGGGSDGGNNEHWSHHLLAGACAGGLAGFVSNPLDLIRTTIQTDTTTGYKSIVSTTAKLREFAATENMRLSRVFFSGATARIAYFIPSTAVTWTTYETMKRFLGFNLDDIEDLLD